MLLNEQYKASTREECLVHVEPHLRNRTAPGLKVKIVFSSAKPLKLVLSLSMSIETQRHGHCPSQILFSRS